MSTTKQKISSIFILLAWQLSAGMLRAEATPLENRWLAPPPCSSEFGREMDNQPLFGMVLWKFECPSGEKKIVSSTRTRSLSYHTCSIPIMPGQTIDNKFCLGEQNGIQKSERDEPLPLERLAGVQAVRTIPENTPLRARDFRPRQLWRPGDPVSVKIISGPIETGIPGIATSLGLFDQRASAKLENGKAISGIARPPNIIEIQEGR